MILESIKSIVWGFPTVLTVAAFGVFFTVKSGLFRPKRLFAAFRTVFSGFSCVKTKGVSPFAAAATAIGGTVGVGSIVGVGYGIAVGGAGSVFWMWVCSFFGMGLKYAEVKAALPARSACEINYGGAPYRLRSLGYKKLSALFCVCCIACSFGTGNLAQSGAAANCLGYAGLSRPVCAAVCFIPVAVAVFGGGKRIASVNAFVIPVASAVYIAVCLALLIMNRSAIPSAFGSIFKNAFGIKPLAGGFSGALLARAIKEGCARSVFSNEAGMGSSPLAHASSDPSGDGGLQCSLGVFEVFFDSFAVSTLTALCLLTAGTDDVFIAFGAESSRFAKVLITALVCLFAFASVISWCFYAESCLVCLFGRRKLPLYVYRVLFSATAFAGAFIGTGNFLAASDILNALMRAPNLFLLFKCRNEIY